MNDAMIVVQEFAKSIQLILATFWYGFVEWFNLLEPSWHAAIQCILMLWAMSICLKIICRMVKTVVNTVKHLIPERSRRTGEDDQFESRRDL